MDVNPALAKEIHRFGVCARGNVMRVLPAYEKRAKKSGSMSKTFQEGVITEMDYETAIFLNRTYRVQMAWWHPTYHATGRGK